MFKKYPYGVKVRIKPRGTKFVIEYTTSFTWRARLEGIIRWSDAVGEYNKSGNWEEWEFTTLDKAKDQAIAYYNQLIEWQKEHLAQRDKAAAEAKIARKERNTILWECP